MGRPPSIVEDYREWQCRLERVWTKYSTELYLAVTTEDANGQGILISAEDRDRNLRPDRKD